MRDVNIVSWPGIFNQLMPTPREMGSFQVRIVPLGEVDEQYWLWLGVHHALRETLKEMGLDPDRPWRG